MELELFLQNYSEEVRTRVLLTGEKIRNHFPDITEQLDLSAKMVAYCFGQSYAELLFTVFPSKKGVKLGFNQGVKLIDNHGLLEGAGKISRYIDLKSDEQLEHPGVDELILQAFELYQRRTRTIEN